MSQCYIIIGCDLRSRNGIWHTVTMVITLKSIISTVINVGNYIDYVVMETDFEKPCHNQILSPGEICELKIELGIRLQKWM